VLEQGKGNICVAARKEKKFEEPHSQKCRVEEAWCKTHVPVLVYRKEKKTLLGGEGGRYRNNLRSAVEQPHTVTPKKGILALIDNCMSSVTCHYQKKGDKLSKGPRGTVSTENFITTEIGGRKSDNLRTKVLKSIQ